MRYFTRIILPSMNRKTLIRLLLGVLFLVPVAAGAQYYVEHANYEGYGPYDYSEGYIGACGGSGTYYQYLSYRTDPYAYYDEYYTYYATDHYCDASERFEGYSCVPDASCGAPAPTCADSGQVGTYPNCSAPPQPTCASSGMVGTYPNCSYAPVAASLSASPSAISAGQSSTLTWSSSNGSSCTGTNFSTGGATSGSVSVSPSANTTYSVSCSGSGSPGSASASVTVSGSVPAPTVTLTAQPSNVYQGQQSYLTWSSTNATTCSSPMFDTGGATSGGAYVNPTQDDPFYNQQSYDTSYAVQCWGPGGTNAGWATVRVANTAAGTSCSVTVTAGRPWALTLDASYTSPPGGEVVGFDAPGSENSRGNNVSGSVIDTWHLTYSTPGSYPIEVWGSGGGGHPYGTSVIKAYGVDEYGNPNYDPNDSRHGVLEGYWSESESWNEWAFPPYYDPSSTALVRCTVNVVEAPAPDLTALGTSVTGSVIAGQTTTFSAQASNVGNTAAGTFSSYFQISNGANAWTGQVGSLAPGASAWVGANYSFPTAGTYTVRLCVDGYGQVSESSEDNNCGPASSVTIYPATTANISVSPSTIAYGGSSTLSWSSNGGASSCTGTGFSTGNAVSGSITVSPTASATYRVDCSGPGGSSYAITNLSVGSPPVSDLYSGIGSGMTVVAGQAATYTGTTYNGGNASASGFSDLFVFYQADQSTWNGYQYAATSGTIAGGGSAGRSVSYTFSTPGTYYYRLCADWNNGVSESNENNNCSGFQVVTVTAPDLTSTTGSAMSVVAGQAATFTGATQNIGNGSAPAGFSDLFIFYQPDQSTWLGYQYAPTSALIGPGSSVARSVSYTFSTPGTYYYRVCADWNNGVSESNEGNNCSGFQSVTVGGADLTAGTTVVGANPVAGTSVNLSAPAYNQGPSTSGSFPMLFQVSQNGALISSGYLAGLAQGASGWGGADYTFPSSGTYSVRACANYNTSWTAIVTETDYSNNCGAWTNVSVASPIPPSVSCTVSPSSVNSGGSVTYQANPAAGATGPYTWVASDGASVGSASSASRTLTTPGSYGMNVKGSNTSVSYCPNVSVAATWCTAGSANLSITATPARVNEGTAVAVSWSATSVSGQDASCTVTGPGVSWTSAVSASPSCSASGSANPTVTTQSTYTLTCGGESKSVTVNVIPKIIEF